MFYIALDLQGGLGNILFQVAAGLALAAKHKCQLVIAKTEFHHMTNGDFHCFLRDIPYIGVAALPSNTIEYTPDKDIELGTPFAYVFPPLEVAIERAKTESRPIRIINGFFQSEIYFSITPGLSIRNRFGPPPDIAELIRVKYACFDLQHTAFLHIRRGDYIGSSFDIGLDKHYFSRAIRWMENITNPPMFYFIFSDDLLYAENLPAVKELGRRAILIPEHNETMALWIMSLCYMGGICSNSTFSWWGGYLNPNPSKRVLWPSEWHYDKYYYPAMVPISVSD